MRSHAELSAFGAYILMRWPACSRRHRLAADITFCAGMGVLPGCSASSRFAGDSVSLRHTNRFAWRPVPPAEDWRRGVFGGEQVWALDERCGYPWLWFWTGIARPNIVAPLPTSELY